MSEETINREYEIIESSGIFDKQWYTNKYLKENKEDPIKHYIVRGWRNNLNPSPEFDTEWYLRRYPDVKQNGINPLIHYILYGEKEGRLPYASFDPSNTTDPYVVILRSGRFDEEWFAKYYSLEGTNVNLIRYYIDYCIIYGLNPSNDFDSMRYLERYPDVKKNGINPFAHYILYGEKEGRKPK